MPAIVDPLERAALRVFSNAVGERLGRHRDGAAPPLPRDSARDFGLEYQRALGLQPVRGAAHSCGAIRRRHDDTGRRRFNGQGSNGAGPNHSEYWLMASPAASRMRAS